MGRLGPWALSVLERVHGGFLCLTQRGNRQQPGDRWQMGLECLFPPRSLCTPCAQTLRAQLATDQPGWLDRRQV